MRMAISLPSHIEHSRVQSKQDIVQKTSNPGEKNSSRMGYFLLYTPQWAFFVLRPAVEPHARRRERTTQTKGAAPHQIKPKPQKTHHPIKSTK